MKKYSTCQKCKKVLLRKQLVFRGVHGNLCIKCSNLLMESKQNNQIQRNIESHKGKKVCSKCRKFLEPDKIKKYSFHGKLCKDCYKLIKNGKAYT